MTFLEARTYLCNKLNISLTDVAAGTNPLFALQDIEDYINMALKKAWDYKPWTFTQGKVSVTAPGTLAVSYSYPTTFEDESIFLIVVNSVAWSGEGKGKRDFADYMKWLSDYPSDASLIWTEYDRAYYLNENAYAPGQNIDLYGKLRSTALSGDSDLLPFSPSSDAEETSGNHAIVTLAYADALGSEKKKNPSQAAIEEKRAYAILDNVWKPIAERRSKSQSQNRPFFNVDDMFASRTTKSNTNIGNFP